MSYYSVSLCPTQVLASDLGQCLSMPYSFVRQYLSAVYPYVFQQCLPVPYC